MIHLSQPKLTVAFSNSQRQLALVLVGDVSGATLATGLAMPWECSSASDGVCGAVHEQRCQAALFELVGQKRTCCGEDLRWLHELVMLADKYISPAQLWLRFESR